MTPQHIKTVLEQNLRLATASPTHEDFMANALRAYEDALQSIFSLIENEEEDHDTSKHQR